jgi:regulatory protein
VPTITAISPQKKRAGRVNVSLDGKFAFGLSTPVAARFGLKVGLELTEERVDELLRGQVYQKALDQALRHLAARAHSAKQIETKLGRKDYGPKVIEQVITRLKELGYINDLDFALRKTDFAAKDKKLGQRRAAVDLIKAGTEADYIPALRAFFRRRVAVQN